ncbi:alpha/beta hydrolase [Fulvivirgaceae bacterium BMA10]|uniref:Alpha/beta hydrolase n=1 Tax=Splendidivirga corallicola TaxID=3051826 RepID=A0ABT8KM42_9BACT|nr:alpha/beta hydrolase [Fulvivirgaceae bacterium BMA10]
MLTRLQFQHTTISILFLTLIHACDNKRTTQEASKNGVSEEMVIHYNVYGESDTTLMFVHGWCIDQTYWDNQLPHFKNQYKIVAVDLAGHGKSGTNRKDWTVQNFSNDLIEIIKEQKLNNIILIGHSMGGDVVLKTALELPDKVIGLIGIDNFKEVDFEMDDEFKRGFNEFIEGFKSDYQGMAEQFAKNALFVPESDSIIVKRVIKDIQKANPAISLSILENLLPIYEQEDSRLEQLHIPLYLIASKELPTDTMALAKHCKKGYGIKLIDSVGHYPMVEKPDEFNQALREILSEMDR